MMTLNVIYHCNQWHEYGSFRLIGVVEENKLTKALRKIQNELGYDETDMNDYIHVDEIELNDLDI